MQAIDEDSTLMSFSRRLLATPVPGVGCEDNNIVTNSAQNRLRLGKQLKIATWNCGGLSHTQRDLCAEYSYDILVLTETHDKGKLRNSRNFITAEAAPDNDRFSGVAILLSDQTAKCVTHSGSCGSRIVYARIRSSPCDLFVIGVYIPHKMRKVKPFAADTLKLLEVVLLKVNSNDCVILLGDFNCKLGRSIAKLSGKWCVHKTPNAEGEQLLDMMRRTNLTAISTFFQPRRRKSNSTYLAKDPTYKPSQIDYILISSRWATSVKNCKVQWGVSYQRWGRPYDHGLVSCVLKTRIKMQRKTTIALDFSILKTDAPTRTAFNDCVTAKLSSEQFNHEDASESLENLQKAVSVAAASTLPKRIPLTLRRRNVSAQTRELYNNRQKTYLSMSDEQRRAASRAISKSTRDDYRSYVEGIVTDMEAANSTGNIREVTRLTKILSGTKNKPMTMPSKDLSGDPIMSSEQLLTAWNIFLAKKFASPLSDNTREREHTVSADDHLTTSELEESLAALKSGKAPGCDGIPIEAYKHSPAARAELFRIAHIIWDSESMPPELVKGIFAMFYKKNSKDDFSNYRAICLLCHAYKLISAVIARRLHVELEPILPDSQAGFRPARGTRDNVCVLKWTINMLLRESQPAVVTFIDYSAAFDTESQLFLDEALSAASVSVKLRRIIQSIFTAASGCVRVTKPNGEHELSDQFDISRGVLQGDIFSPVAFIVGLMRTFAIHDKPGSGVEVGAPPYQVKVSSLEYADDAALLDANVQQASERLSSIAAGSRNDAAMDISIPKTKAMHIHRRVSVSKTEIHEIAELKLKFICPDCTRDFPKQRSLSQHQARWCLGVPAEANTRSRTGTLADKAVQKQKRIAHENILDHVKIEGKEIDNVHHFEYLGSRQQCDGDDRADVKFRMDIAQSRFSSLHHIWKDHRLPRALKIRLYKASVCSTLTHACEAWQLTEDVRRMLNGFNSRCLHTITKQPYRDTACNPSYDLLLAIRKRRLRFLGHILRMNPERLVRRTLQAYVNGGTDVPEGSLLQDCEAASFEELTRLANNKKLWQRRVNEL